MDPDRPGALAEVARYFFRLGVIAFGGPAAHIAIMRRELVHQRRWVSDQEFLDMLGVTNLIPGPNSTEMTMHLGHRRAGMAGLWLGGLLFIMPAVAIVTALAWAYVRYGTTPAGEGVLLGAQPVVLAVILQAGWGLAGSALRGIESIAIAAGVVVLALLGVSEIILVLGAGIFVLAVTLAVGAVVRPAWRRLPNLPRAGAPGRPARRRRRDRGRRGSRAWLPPLPAAASLPAAAGTAGVSTAGIFFAFLKIGALLYGSGYVLVSFMRGEFVERRGWLTEAQLVDAIAAGQVTPGPLFSSAAFAGYVMDGLRGACAASAGIFLPSFFFVMLVAPVAPRLRGWQPGAAFLDGVNAAAFALILVAGAALAREVLDTWFTVALFALALVATFGLRIGTGWLVLGGIAAGLVYRGLG